MSSKRTLQNKQKCAVCSFIENEKGVPCTKKADVQVRWISQEENILWWPRGTNIMSTESFWDKYELIKAIIEGME